MRFVILLILIILFVVCNFQSVDSKKSTAPTILGIDFGSEFIKVGYASRGKPIDLILNEQSKRKTSNYLGFRKENERLFGESARQITARFPSAAARYYLQMFLGKRYALSEEFLNNRCKHDLGLTGWEWKENQSRKTTDIVLRGEDDVPQVFQPEELVAYMLRYIVGLVDPNTQHVSGVVITVPPYFTLEQRQAIISAAKLADIKLIGLLSETAALGIQYGVTRFTKLKDQLGKDQAHNAIIFDMGATTITSSVIQFTETKSKDPTKLGAFKILSTKWSKNLGGEDFTNRLSQYLASKFKEAHNIDISTNDRVMERVRAFAKKAKEVLTANSETVVYMESIYNDIDFRIKITRAEFEEMCESLISRVLEPVRESLIESKLTLDDIESFDVVGGGARVMAVQDKLNRFFKKGISHTLNGDESIAIGSVLYGASKSPLFRVRSFDFKDYNPFGIEFVLSASEHVPEKVYQLFKVGDSYDIIRHISIPRHSDFSLTLKFAESSRPSDYPEDGIISRYHFKNVKEAMAKFSKELEADKEATAKVRIGFELDSNGIIKFESAAATLEQYVIVESEVNSNDTDTAQSNTKKEKVVKREIVDVEVESFTIPQITESEDFEKLKDRMLQFEKIEEERRRVAHSRNDLEANFYSTQSSLDDEEFLPFFLPEEIKSLKVLLEATDEWLMKTEYDDSIPADDYIQKNRDILNLIQPVKERREEEAKRMEKVDSCKYIFKKLKKSVAGLAQKVPHVTDEEKKKFLDTVEETESWLAKIMEKQKSVPVNQPPIVTVTELDSQCNKLNAIFSLLSNKPAPKPEEPVKESQETMNQESTNQQEQTQSSESQSSPESETQETKENSTQNSNNSNPEKDEL